MPKGVTERTRKRPAARAPAKARRGGAARPAKAPRVTTVAAYLAAAPPEPRARLRALLQVIRTALPGATEGISYGIVVFRNPRMLVGAGVTGEDCVFYLLGTKVLAAHAAELAGWRLGKGSIHFPPGRPVPAALVRKLVRARVEEAAGRAR